MEVLFYMDLIISERLVISLGKVQDITELEMIEKECEKYFSFDPQCELNHNKTIKECLTVRDIPTGGKKENYYFYCIRQDNILIGFLDYYLEYKEKDTVYFSSIYIKEAYRKNGIGKKIIDAIINKFTLIGINEIYLHVSLRNAIAIQFWVKQGFDHIISVEHNGNLLPENFGGIELMKRI
jgi:ribosomal protein S18 acetylase RimI-like enzyme